MNHFRSETASALISSPTWVEYFRRNRDSLFTIPWQARYPLTVAEKKAIARSLSIFQLGESSEGKSFRRAAQRYVGETGDIHYLDAQHLFMREEHRHAEIIGRFMQQQSIPTRSHSWSDTLFRFIRRGQDLETAITILITAEFIARVYYDALRDATHSPILHTICDQILQDERAHIKFQAQRIAMLRKDQSWFTRRLKNIAYRSFFTLTSLVVWIDHRPVFKHAHYRFRHYLSETQRILNLALHEMEPRPATSYTPEPSKHLQHAINSNSYSSPT